MNNIVDVEVVEKEEVVCDETCTKQEDGTCVRGDGKECTKGCTC